MSEKRPPPPEIPIEREPTWEEFERRVRQLLTFRPARKRRPKAPKPTR